jgi:hypothetical protein
VEVKNSIARALYAGLGYRDLYYYETIWLKG